MAYAANIEAGETAMERKIFELTESQMKAVIGGARLPATPYQIRLPVQRRADSPAAS